MSNKIVAHTSFLGHTGYANHSRNFLTHLNKHIPVKVRNFAYDKDTSYLTEEQRDMIYYNTYHDAPPFDKRVNDLDGIHLVLMETNHYYFYHDYEGPKIAYNVWESTRQPEHFFRRLLEYDQLWVPTEWQKQVSIEQGYPEDRVKVVPEGVDGNKFHPYESEDERKKILEKYGIPEDAFVFMIFGRWDYRKATKEMIESFLNVFEDMENVYLVASIDNPFPADGFSTTEERMDHYGFNHDKIKILHFPPNEEYIKWLQLGDVFVSCSRSEGWNLPLIESIACGCVTICSDYGAQLEFADEVSHKVNIKEMKKPKEVFMFRDSDVPGYWAEPDFKHLEKVMMDCYENHENNKEKALIQSEVIRDKFSWENAAKKASEYLEKFKYVKIIKNDRQIFNFNDGYNNIIVQLDGRQNPVVRINGDEDIRYIVSFEDVWNERTYFLDVITNNQYCACYSSNIHDDSPIIFIEVMSEKGYFLSFSFDKRDGRLWQRNIKPINLSELEPPVIITGSIGGGTSYITKFLRYCGLHVGSCACDKERRKTHEGRSIKDLEEVSRFKDDEFMIKIRGDRDVRKFRDGIDEKYYEYVDYFRNALQYKLDTFFDGIDHRNVKWGFKTPLSTFGLPIYTSIFPNAKVINIRKDKKKYRSTSKTEAGRWFYRRSQRYSLDSYFNPDLRNKICSEEDTKFIEDAYYNYINNVSTDEFAISINTALYLYFLCDKFKPKRVLERGSGFSTFVFAYYKSKNPDVKVDTIETSNGWLNKTTNFVRSYGFDADNYFLWRDFEEYQKYDFIFEDTKTDLRIETIDYVMDLMDDDGIIVFDDANRHNSREREYYLEKKTEERNLHFFSLKKYTFDRFGRYACLVTNREDIDNEILHPSEDVKYLDFERFVSDYKYANKFLEWMGLKSFKNQNEFADMLEQTKFEGKIEREGEEDDVVVVNAYANNKEKTDTLKECLKQLRKTGKEIILSTHFPVGTDIQRLVDYYVYDCNNPMLDKGCFYWFESDDIFYRSNRFGLSTKAYANMSALKNGVEFAQRIGKKFFYYMEYDSIIDDSELHKLGDLRSRIDSEGKKGYAQVVTQDADDFCEYSIQHKPDDSLSLIFFAFYTEFFLKNFDFANDKDEYQRRSKDVMGLEWFFYDNMQFVLKDITKDYSCRTFPVYFENSKFGSCADGENLRHYIDIIREEDDGNIILIILFQDVKEGSKDKDGKYTIKTYDDSNKKIERYDVEIKGNYFYDVLNKNIKRLEVFYEDEIVFDGIVENEVRRSSSQFFFKNKDKKDNRDLRFNFSRGPLVEIKGPNNDFNVNFIDDITSEIIHSGTIGTNQWIKCNREYYTDWRIEIKPSNENPIFFRQNLKNENVLISFESKSLGDTIAWIPFAEEFRKKHECNVFLSTFWNDLFYYPNINFINPGDTVSGIYARYEVGCFDDNLCKNKYNWCETPLQKIASDILGLEHEEIKPIMKNHGNFNIGDSNFVAISEHSTAKCKYWNYKGGWQIVVEYLRKQGFEPMVVSKEKTKLKNIIDETGNPIEKTIENLRKSRFIITLSNGPAWLAWAYNIPVIMISGCTEEWNEFKCDRLINTDVCHGCLNNNKYRFDRGDWNWCPSGKDFECTKSIHPGDVIKVIKKYK